MKNQEICFMIIVFSLIYTLSVNFLNAKCIEDDPTTTVKHVTTKPTTLTTKTHHATKFPNVTATCPPCACKL